MGGKECQEEMGKKCAKFWSIIGEIPSMLYGLCHGGIGSNDFVNK